MPLIGMAILMYSIMVDHDAESCGPLIIIISVVDMLFVILFTHKIDHILTNPISTLSRASPNVYTSSVHGHSQVQNGGRCSSISLSCFPISSSSFGMLYTVWDFPKESF